MEFYSSIQSQMQMNTDKCIWEFDEDDLFYAELRKQVLLLTAEDDDVEELHQNKLQTSAKTLQQKLYTSPATSLQQGCYYNWSGNEVTESVPTWLFNLWKSGNGTGVFIPQIVKSRRRYKPRKKSNERGRMYKQVADVYS